jgi:hypothetical protein
MMRLFIGKIEGTVKMTDEKVCGTESMSLFPLKTTVVRGVIEEKSVVDNNTLVSPHNWIKPVIKAI